MEYFDKIFANFDNYMFESFIDDVKKRHGLKGDTKELSQFIVEALKVEAYKRRNNNMYAFGLDSGKLEHSVIIADTLLPKWKASKDKKEVDKTDIYREKEANSKAKKPKQTDEYYFDKNGQKHTKKKPVKKVQKEESEEEFDYTQLELF